MLNPSPSNKRRVVLSYFTLYDYSECSLRMHRECMEIAQRSPCIEIVVYTWREHRELVFYIYLHSQEGTAVIYWAKFASIQNMWVHVQNGWPFWKSQISRRDKNCYNFLKENQLPKAFQNSPILSHWWLSMSISTFCFICSRCH